MLVTLAVLLIMMTVIVQIFQAATGALSSAQGYQELDNQLRQLDVMIRSDLNGVTARMTPPLNPNNNLGYLEYGENEFAVAQGEDSDDYIRFTAKAPAGRPFTGRMYVPPLNGLTLATMNLTQQQIYLATQPITITSEYAEIIYFLRNGNLYRRVLLVAPERQSVIWQTNSSFAQALFGGLNVNAPVVSWQGMNDLSAHPSPSGNTLPLIVLNTLGALTNRENRFAYPRFTNDYQDLNGNVYLGGDGQSDDVNGDNVPDYYTSLYPHALAPTKAANNNQLIFEPGYPAVARNAPASALSFPYVFPGAYSIPQNISSDTYGWIHSPEPLVNVNLTPVIFEGTPPYTSVDYLRNLNHNPVDVGDNLALPLSQFGILQTWWGFPTWRETLSPNWNDPTYPVNGSLTGPLPQQQPNGLSAYNPTALTVVTSSGALLPPMNVSSAFPFDFGLFRRNPQPFSDGAGGNSVFWGGPTAAELPLWSLSWEDDLIMTGVRSFDIKAYDNTLAGYADLGWGDDLRYYPLIAAQNTQPTTPPFIYGTPNLNLVTNNNPGFTPTPGVPGFTPYLFWNNQFVDLINQTYAHEGRMPPLIEDNRYDFQFGPVLLNTYLGAPTYPANNPNYIGNVGDDTPGVVRLRRVWDSWSTDYSRAPATGEVSSGFPWGPPYSPPIYPSYPPPYPAPLRGIQIQIRVTDPTNQRIKTLTIRQDFTDKL